MIKIKLKLITILVLPLTLQSAQHFDYYRQLVNAEEAGNLDSVIKNGIDLNIESCNYFSALHFAALNNQVNIIKALINAKANVNIKFDTTSLHPLELAATNAQHEAIIELLKAKANVNAVDKYGYTALNISCHKANPTSIKILLNHGAIIGNKDNLKSILSALDIDSERGKLLIHILSNQKDQVLKLSMAQIPIEILNCVDYNQMTPLMYAAARGYTDIIKILLDYNNNFGGLDFTTENQNALELAQSNNHKVVVNLFTQFAIPLSELIHQSSALPIPLARIITKLLFGQNCIFNQLKISEQLAPVVTPNDANSRCVIE